MNIRTVLGDIAPENLGVTMIHEHLAFDLSGVRGDADSVLDADESMYQEMAMIRRHCTSIVEVSNRGMGRDVRKLEAIAKKMDFHIVCATGYYKQEHYPDEVRQLSREELAELMTGEVTGGIDNTGIKAGIISEIGSSYQALTQDEQKVFHAACDAQMATGAPMSTHCELGTMGTEQLRIFDAEGLDPKRVSFGHQDLNTNLEEQTLLLREGYYLQFDTIGKNRYRSNEDRLTNLLQLLERGFASQLMLSTDISRRSYFRGGGGNGYVYLFDTFLPQLREAGVDDASIQLMLVENPERFLAF